MAEPETQPTSMQPPAGRGRFVLYAATVFLASAVLLVLEIAAGRLIAPYVGVSLYTWTSIIGVILAGLSVGNWLGGMWADRGGGDGAAGVSLLLSSIAALLVLLMLTLVAPAIQASQLSLLGASFLFVACLFFLPALMLGIVTPLLTTLALKGDSRPGHVVGSMHAMAALGSIVGTFVTGYWLVQYFGTRNVILMAAALLALLAAPFLVRSHRRLIMLISIPAAGVVIATNARGGFENPCHEESQYYCIRVEDASRDVPFGQARDLVLDHLLHGTNHETEPGMLVAPYAHLIDELVLGYLGADAATARYFFAGGGAYTLPRAVRELAPEASVTVAEIDPLVTDTAEKQLYVSTDGMRVLHMDARVALQGLDGERFDVIVGDVYQDVAVPYHLTTREFAALAKARLAPDGVYLLNLTDAFPDPLLVKSMLKTLREQFRYVHVWIEEPPTKPTRITYVVSATDSAEPPVRLTAQRGFERQWMRATEVLAATGTPMDNLPVLTDDFVPVERLVSRLLTTELGR